MATANLETAARHPRITRVLAVGASTDDTFDHLSARSAGIAERWEKPVEVVVQDRIGSRRHGKGDGMNTGLRRFLDTDEQRLHFYDADITNFDATWIEGAERAADRGFGLVRHYFPRSSTDAMITWMITRPGFALTHPESLLWRIRQPLGGELLLSRPMVESLVGDPAVAACSDWGIDTVITFVTASTGEGIYEHFVSGGKQHALYGSLSDIRDMVIECFEAVWSLAERPSPPQGEHVIEPDAPATEAVATKVGYDVETTIHLLAAPWSTDEVNAAALLPDNIAEPILANIARPTFAFMDAERWGDTLVALLAHYRSEPGWRALVFRLWVARVLAYTTTDALGGHARAMSALEKTISGYASAGKASRG